MKHHRPRAFRTVAGQRKRLEWMLKQCEIHGWIHLAALVQQQLDLIDGI